MQKQWPVNGTGKIPKLCCPVQHHFVEISSISRKEVAREYWDMMTATIT